PLQSFQRADDRSELHPIVGGVLLGSCEFLELLGETQRSPPASRPGVAAACAVRINLNDPHRVPPPPRSGTFMFGFASASWALRGRQRRPVSDGAAAESASTCTHACEPSADTRWPAPDA